MYILLNYAFDIVIDALKVTFVLSKLFQIYKLSLHTFHEFV